MDDSTLLPIWNALADAKRRQIVELLKERPRTTSELCAFFDVSRYAVMKHLNVLEQAGLLVVRREGRKRWNILDDQAIGLFRGGAAAGDNGADRLSEIITLFPIMAQTVSGVAPIGATDIGQDTMLRAARKDVFRALTEQVNAWWRWRAADSQAVYLEPIVNGRFYQAFDAAGHGELLAWVTYIKPDEEIRFGGPMGLADTGAISFVRLQLESWEDGTRLRLRHRLIGEVDEQLVQRFRSQWHDLFNHCLKAFVEEGISYQSLKNRPDRQANAPALSEFAF